MVVTDKLPWQHHYLIETENTTVTLSGSVCDHSSAYMQSTQQLRQVPQKQRCNHNVPSASPASLTAQESYAGVSQWKREAFVTKEKRTSGESSGISESRDPGCQKKCTESAEVEALVPSVSILTIYFLDAMPT